GEVLAQVKKGHVEQLPIPKNISGKQENEIIKLVEQILQLNKEKQTATLSHQKEQLHHRIEYAEDKINQIIYALYDLTADEIKIIEDK
ncbi:MAG TPA: hypothetical protein PKN63_08045, partial [Chitinophagales bacterium]|nr:hypothetical protein [Chitinophagales bacterium]